MKQKIGVKGLIVTILTLVLLLPTYFIDSVIYDRIGQQTNAAADISSKWAEAQTLTGPFVTVPFKDTYKDEKGNLVSGKGYFHILPDQLNITGAIVPEKRYRGIFQVVVYNAKLSIKGKFPNLLTSLPPKIATQDVLFDEAVVSLGIPDLRGIKENIPLSWNSDAIQYFNPGIDNKDISSSGISAPIKININNQTDKPEEFSFDLNLNGSQSLNFTPVGKETTVSLTSIWKTPSFTGAFLPETRTVNGSGFNAFWKVLHLNRNFPQSWFNSDFKVAESIFGVNLFTPIDNYTKANRSIKYAILIIGLTFLTFFFLELINNKSVHPLQYILVGFALCVFYLLLLSISEHISYNFAYLIASILTIGLIAWYSKSVLKDDKLAILIGTNLVLLYGFIFVLIQLEDLALLVGSIGLFLVLAFVMYFSRRINFNGAIKSEEVQND